MREIGSGEDMAAWILKEYPLYDRRQAVRDGASYFAAYQNHYIKRHEDALAKQQALLDAQATTSQALQTPMAAMSLGNDTDSVACDDTSEGSAIAEANKSFDNSDGASSLDA